MQHLLEAFGRKGLPVKGVTVTQMDSSGLDFSIAAGLPLLNTGRLTLAPAPGSPTHSHPLPGAEAVGSRAAPTTALWACRGSPVTARKQCAVTVRNVRAQSVRFRRSANPNMLAAKGSDSSLCQSFFRSPGPDHNSGPPDS